MTQSPIQPQWPNADPMPPVQPWPNNGPVPPVPGQWSNYGQYAAHQSFQSAPIEAPGKPPKVWPVVVLTLLFSVFGAISAAVQGNKATKLGHKQTSYWVAFGVTLFCSIVLISVASAVGSSIASPGSVVPTAPAALGTAGNPYTAAWLDPQLTAGTWTNGITATTATCAYADNRSDGTGTYRCDVTFSNGMSAQKIVTVPPDGQWVAGG